jgi:hypothetical protein
MLYFTHSQDVNFPAYIQETWYGKVIIHYLRGHMNPFMTTSHIHTHVCDHAHAHQCRATTHLHTILIHRPLQWPDIKALYMPYIYMPHCFFFNGLKRRIHISHMHCQKSCDIIIWWYDIQLHPMHLLIWCSLVKV